MSAILTIVMPVSVRALVAVEKALRVEFGQGIMIRQDALGHMIFEQPEIVPGPPLSRMSAGPRLGYGCHAYGDDVPPPTECLLDPGVEGGPCEYARKHGVRKRRHCMMWRPIGSASPDVQNYSGCFVSDLRQDCIRAQGCDCDDGISQADGVCSYSRPMKDCCQTCGCPGNRDVCACEPFDMFIKCAITDGMCACCAARKALESVRLYCPSNGTEGLAFMAEFCDQCSKNGEIGTDSQCDILSRTMLHKIGDPGYPQEWRYDDRAMAICTAFIKEGSE